MVLRNIRIIFLNRGVTYVVLKLLRNVCSLMKLLITFVNVLEGHEGPIGSTF